MKSSILRLEQVQKYFNILSQDPPVLHMITNTFWQGHTYAIQGASGAGKSSLMHILAGLDTPSSGAVFFNDQNLALMDPAARDRFLQQSVGLLFQQPYLIKELTVLENVMLPALLAAKAHATCYEDAVALIAAVDLSHKMDEKPRLLSGGQQQRVALARALINKPAFLLADEPTGNLDTATGKKIVDLMHELHATWRLGIIVSTHDSYVAEAMATHYTLKEGILSLK